MCVSSPLSRSRILLAAIALVVAPQAASAQSTAIVAAGQAVKADDRVRPIASITKVMTAAVAAEELDNPDRVVTIQRGESSRRLRRGDKVRVGDLMRLMLVASDNGAARALARAASGSVAAFVALMNAKAAGLGLYKTRFSDPAGLLATNTSTASEVAAMMLSIASNPRLEELLSLPAWSFKAGRRTVAATNTNRLMADPGLEVLAGKTGTTRRAGFCLAAILKAPDGGRVAVVVLGARSSAARFLDARRLFAATIGGA